MRLQYLFCCIIFLTLFSSIGLTQNNIYKNGISLKSCLFDFHSPFNDKIISFEDFEEMSYGVEVGYFKNIDKNLNIGFPFRLGTMRLPIMDTELPEKKWMGSLDGIIQLGFFDEPRILKPYIFVGAGGMFEELAGNAKINAVIPLGLGFNVRLNKGIYLQAQSEYRKVFTYDRDHLTHSLGLLLVFNFPKEAPIDTDGDGLADIEDECPLWAGPARMKGCPDLDKDMITDKDDKCPEVAGLSKHFGCPDSDGDDLPDQLDDCPEEAGPKENNGCPIIDTDGDGVMDPDDNCPNEPGLVENKGCPKVILDSDGDGVMDSDDKCPTTFGPKSNNGCPEISKEDKEILTFAIQNIEFEISRATLKATSFQILDQIKDILNRYPDYNITISGHTDNIGSAEKNLILSENRARACYSYLLQQGVDASRIKYIGYGETQPIADNRYKNGRQLNRRVEFNIYLK